MNLVDRLSSTGVLLRSWPHIAARRGPAGSDGVTIAAFAGDLEANVRRLCDDIGCGEYKPLEVVRTRAEFLDPLDSDLVVLTVRDQLVQRAIADLLAPMIDATLSASCRAFRRDSSAPASAGDVDRWLEQGDVWVLRADISKLVEHIKIERLLEKLSPFLDTEGLEFLASVISSSVLDQLQLCEAATGLPQGSPLLPFLSNLYLAEVDHAMARQYRRYLRYCDDMIVLESSEERVRQALAELRAQLAPLELQPDERTTTICQAGDGFVFLGFAFGSESRRPDAKAVRALHYRLDQLARGPAGNPLRREAREIVPDVRIGTKPQVAGIAGVTSRLEASANRADGAISRAAAELGVSGRASSDDSFDIVELAAVFRGWSSYFGDTPELWAAHPAGLLCLLRRATASQDQEPEQLAEARWRLPRPVSWQLAQALGKAWLRIKLPEHAWFELLAAATATGSETPDLESWAALLELDSDRLQTVVRGVLEAEEAGTENGSQARLSALAAALDELGRQEVAQRLLGFGAAPLVASGEAPEPGVSPEAIGDDELAVLEEWFRGREGAHSVVPGQGSDQHRPRVIHRAISRADWREHLLGDRSIALALVRADQTTFLGVLTVSAEGEALEESWQHTLDAGHRLRSELAIRGCAAVLERHSDAGLHLWVRLDEPVLASDLRGWLLEVRSAAGPFSDGVKVGVLPDGGRVRLGALGPSIRLPLGVNPGNGQRCDLLEGQGQPVGDPIRVLSTTPRLPAAVIREWAQERRSARISSLGPDSIPGRAAPLLEHCHVLWALRQRAEESGVLGNREQQVLLWTLRHLGEDGVAAIHAISSHLYDYQPEVTAHRIKKAPRYPISCPRIRQWLPWVTAAVGCGCHFDLRNAAYPTPLLHVLEGVEIPFPDHRAVPEQHDHLGPTERAEQLLSTLGELQRRQRCLGESVEQLEQQLLAILDEIDADSLELAACHLRRRQRDDGQGWELVLAIEPSAGEE